MLKGLAKTALALAVAAGGAGAAEAFEPVDTSAFVEGFGPEQIMPHLKALNEIAKENGGNRAVGTAGYRASKDYVKDQLRAAGYAVELQKFSALVFIQKIFPVMERLSPSPKKFKFADDFLTLEFSGSADVSARLGLARGIEIPPGSVTSSTSGCTPNDFPKRIAGTIALIQRGGCDFVDKARNAEAAGAVGAIIFNEGQEGRQEALSGTLGEPGIKIPVLGASYAVGKDLYEQVKAGRAVRMRVRVSAEVQKFDSTNVLADLEGEVKDRTVVVGAHLDSVPAGPGINDNGSGTATVLAIAERFAKRGIKPRNTVRFGFWGAEEEGLVGSTQYVESLSARELSRIALNLNFDMLASPNFAVLVYDGDGSEGDAGPAGSDVIEKVFVDYFKERGLPSLPTFFDGRSDYLAFIENDIPAGGLFSGAEEIKTRKEARLFGGKAGEPLDPCYHKACDDIGNVSEDALIQFAPAAAHAVYTFAQTREDIRASESAQMSRTDTSAAARNAVYRGSKLVR